MLTGPALRGVRRASAVHQHLPERRGHSVRVWAQDAAEGQRRSVDRPGGRRRITPVARTTVRLTFPGETLNDPIIYRIGQEYTVVNHIRRADAAQDSGWVE